MGHSHRGYEREALRLGPFRHSGLRLYLDLFDREGRETPFLALPTIPGELSFRTKDTMHHKSVACLPPGADLQKSDR